MTRRSGRSGSSRAADGEPPEAHQPASWMVEFQRSPPLTILFSLAVIMIMLVVTRILPVEFLIPAALLLAVVGNGEIRPILAERRIAQVGRVVPATVTKLEPMKRIKKHPFETNWTMEYRYDDSGRTHRGRTRPLPWQVLSALDTGHAIAIHVHPEDPERSVWIGGG